MSLVESWNEGALTWVEIRRPDKLNSLDRAALAEVRERLRAESQQREGVLLLTGAGERAFCAGADIREMSGLDAAAVRQLMEEGKETCRLLEQCPRPVIAVVNGFALGGGCELALACDLVCAAETAQFGLPEVDLGVLPGWGGSQRIERRVGYGRARDMVLTGRRVPAAEALSWGLCDRVFPPDRLREEAAALATVIAEKDPGSAAAIKEALRRRSELPLSEGLALETDLFVRLFDRPERERAMGRFVKK